MLFLLRGRRRRFLGLGEKFRFVTDKDPVNVEAGQAFNVAQILILTRLTHRDRNTGFAGPCRPTDPVDIGFRQIRQVVIDDMGDIVDVNAACRDVGRDEDLHGAGLEPVQRLDALGLGLVAVDGGRLQAVIDQVTIDLVGTMLGPREDNRALDGLVRHQLQQEVLLGLLGQENDRLLDAFDRT